MRLVPLSKGYFAKVSDKDYARVMAAGPWHVFSNGYKFYAVHTAWDTKLKRARAQYMHRFVLGVEDRKVHIDHNPDFNGLNNQRSNLRTATQTENNCNVGKRTHNTSGYKGVCWSKDKGKWQAALSFNEKNIFLGRYVDPKEAAKAYDRGAIKYFGKFACTNERLGLL